MGVGRGKEAGRGYLLKQCVVGAIQVESAQVVAVGEDEEGFFIWRQRTLASASSAASPNQLPPTPSARLTSDSFAAVGVATTGGIALHAQTFVAAMGVDAALAAGEGGTAFVHISTCSPVVLQPEARAAAALEGGVGHRGPRAGCGALGFRAGYWEVRGPPGARGSN